MPTESRALMKLVLARKTPTRILYAPNYWQWFTHHQAHNRLPEPLRHCQSQLDMIRTLGLDVFSRNCYADPKEYWFGGLCDEIVEGLPGYCERTGDGNDVVTRRTFETSKGMLHERRRYVWSETTLVQEKFLVDDSQTQLSALEELVRRRRWRFRVERYAAEQAKVGPDGLVVAGELFSPLKMLHLAVGPINTVYLATDYPDRTRTLCAAHEDAQLDLVRQMATAGVPAMMAMDNLDTAFHPPHYVERFSASFYERASRICHEHGSTFLIHACGRQKANLKRIRSLGVDGLEGVAYPPMGDVSLVEALETTGDRFIITGGISAAEFGRWKTRADVFAYVKALFQNVWPHRHRFIFSASCNTPINATYEQIDWLRAAWMKYNNGEHL